MTRIHMRGTWVILSLMVCILAGWASISAAGPERPGSEKRMEGLIFRLSDQDGLPDRPLAPASPTEPLPDDALKKLLDRLPQTPGPIETKEFSFPPETQPAPRAAERVTQPFPPPEKPPVPEYTDQTPLTVIRFAPEGNVPLAPNLSLTFSRPVAPLSTAISETPPEQVTLDPDPKGTWRWLGTRTLIFEPDHRFPMATDYRVTVKTSPEWSSGVALAQPFAWSFSTPPPKVVSFYPQGQSQPLTPVLLAIFDQKVDPEAVRPAVRVEVKGQVRKSRLAGPQDLEAYPDLEARMEKAGKGRWVALALEEPLPKGEKVQVRFGPDLPSAEGPKKTEKAQDFFFSTYGAFKVIRHKCLWDNECPPLTPWVVRLSNPIDESEWSPDLVRVEPPLPGLKTEIRNQDLIISGLSQGRTHYRVTLSSKIKDCFGQTLGRDQTLDITTGSADPRIAAPAGEFVVLDPAGRPGYSVYTINYPKIQVRVFRVGPEDLPMFRDLIRSSWDRSKVKVPGLLLADETLTAATEKDRLTETVIDLEPYLNQKPGQLLLEIKPVLGAWASLFSKRRDEERTVYAWLQATDIGLEALADGENLLVWATGLTDGRPLEGVSLQLQPQGPEAVTDARGLARIALPKKGGGFSALAARKDRDLALLLENRSWWGGGGWSRKERRDRISWCVFDDRGMYRPGETVHVKGWVRKLGAGPWGDVGLIPEIGPGTWLLSGSRGNEISKGTFSVNPLGGFDLVMKLPENMNLGDAGLVLSLDRVPPDLEGATHTHMFQVQEFRRPEFEVTAQAGPGPFLVGGAAQVEVEARYYAGGGLPQAEVTWRVTSRPGHFSPPGWAEYAFGIWQPWWIDFRDSRGVVNTETMTGLTDAQGKHNLKIDLESVNPPRPMSVSAEATVMDLNRQAWSSEKVLLVHPADVYVGLKTERTFVDPGQAMDVSLIVTDLDGAPVSGVNVEFTVSRRDWTLKKGEWIEEDSEVTRLKAVSADKPVTLSFTPKEGGTYVLEAAVTDARGRANRTEMRRWVSGAKQPAQRNLEQEKTALIPDREIYRPGDTAEILIQAPFYPAEALVTLQRAGLAETRTVRIEGPSHTLKIPMDESFIPNVHLQVDLVGRAVRQGPDGKPAPDLPPRPAYALGTLNLSVPPRDRTLKVEVTPEAKKLEPGGQTFVDLVLKDAQGRPVAGAEAALVVVDEAVLALTGHRLPDPLTVFYPERSNGVDCRYSRADIILVNPEDVADQIEKDGLSLADEKMMVLSESTRDRAPMPMAAPPAGAAPGGGEPPAIRARVNLDPLAVFAPETRTDDQGRARIKVTLPDNLTRYRIMVAAVSGPRDFGLGESAITARLPLMVRPSPPRFLNFGDVFELPVTVQNQTDQPLTVDVAVRAENLELTQGAGRRVVVPAEDRVEIRFPAATVQAGQARFMVGAASGSWADASRMTLPVYTPATTETAAVYGVLDQGSVSQPIAVPENVFPQFGGLSVSTSATALAELTDALLYLVDYPFECSEQVASRLMSVMALKDVLAAFKTPGLPGPEELGKAMKRDLERLTGMQNHDGGFPIWRRGESSWPFHSIHAANALIRAQEAGLEVPSQSLDRALAFIREIDRHFPKEYSQTVKDTLTAYALAVRAQKGEKDLTSARKLMDRGIGKLPLEAAAWLLEALARSDSAEKSRTGLRRLLDNRAVETAGAAHFAVKYDDQDYLLLRSDRRTDGLILGALILDRPDNDLIPKIVRGLLNHRKKGRWNNTQENVFILLALERYFKTFEGVSPDFAARIWLGERFAGQAEFRERTGKEKVVDVPMAFLKEMGDGNVLIAKDGPGRLYYRLGVKFAPRDLDQDPADYGFTVLRTYQAVDDPGDVRRDGDGTWRIKAGARVRVTLNLVAPTRRYHVALTDPLPAGLEAINPALAVSGQTPIEEKPGGLRPWSWWWGPWYEHQNLRDQRAEAFRSLLWSGVYAYTYYARATTLGRFVVPPAKAEEMYAPETFGRTGSDRVIVE